MPGVLLGCQVHLHPLAIPPNSFEVALMSPFPNVNGHHHSFEQLQ